MCRAIRDGGQRCARHAHKAMQSAAHRLNDALSNHNAGRAVRVSQERVDIASHVLYQRQCDYASTSEGAALFSEYAHAAQSEADEATDEHARAMALTRARYYTSIDEQGATLRRMADEQHRRCRDGIPLTVVPAIRLPRQGWVARDGARFDADHVAPLESSSAIPKPDGGLWTSQRDRAGLTEWEKWTRAEGDYWSDTDSQSPSVELYANPTASVLVIDSGDEYWKLCRAHPGPGRDPHMGAGLDWATIGRAFNAVHVSSRLWRSDDQSASGRDLRSAWDFPHTVWSHGAALRSRPPRDGWSPLRPVAGRAG